MQIEISANARDAQGTGASRRLRHAGRVPGIVYGGGRDAQPIDLDHKELFLNMRHEAFHASILTMNLDGRKEQVLLRDVQMHPYKKQVLHVDFQRVAQDQAIHLKVPLHFLNEAIAPGVKLGHGIVQHVMTELDVLCLPKDLPEFIEVDLAHLELGHSVHISQIKLPAGVEAVALRSGEDPVIATVQGHGPAAEGEAAEGGEAAAGGETPAA